MAKKKQWIEKKSPVAATVKNEAIMKWAPKGSTPKEAMEIVREEVVRHLESKLE